MKNFQSRHTDLKNDLKLFFSKGNFSYVQMASEMIQNWEENKFLNTLQSYLRTKQVLEKCKSNLIENEVK